MRRREEVKSILNELRYEGVITGDGFVGVLEFYPEMLPTVAERGTLAFIRV